MFELKTQEEIDKMTAEEYGAYIIAKNEHDAKVRKQEISQAIEALKKENNDANKEVIEKYESQIATVQKATEELGLRMKQITEQNKGGNLDLTKTDLVKHFEGQGERSKSGEGGMKKVVVKAAALMTTANIVPNVADGFNQLFGNYIDPTIYHAPKPENFILALVDVQSAPGTESIWYVQRINLEGDAAFIAEGALKPLADGEYKEFKAPIKEVAVRWKFSNRLMMHAPSSVTDFTTHARELVEQRIDTGVLLGDGTGNELNGITDLASPFIVPAELALSYEDANIWDVIMAVATYVRLNNFKGALTAVLNTVWMAKMASYKDTQNNYIIPPFVTKDGKQVGEVRIQFENKMPDDKILLGDLKSFKVRFSEEIIYAEGWENDDFSKNLTSRKLEAFLGTYLPSNLAGSIIYDDIATILTAIETP